MDWIGENWIEIVLILNTIILLAGRIAKLTPTDKDDKAVAWIKNLLLTIGLEPKKNG